MTDKIVKLSILSETSDAIDSNSGIIPGSESTSGIGFGSPKKFSAGRVRVPKKKFCLKNNLKVSRITSDALHSHSAGTSSHSPKSLTALSTHDLLDDNSNNTVSDHETSPSELFKIALEGGIAPYPVASSSASLVSSDTPQKTFPPKSNDTEISTAFGSDLSCSSSSESTLPIFQQGSRELILSPRNSESELPLTGSKTKVAEISNLDSHSSIPKETSSVGTLGLTNHFSVPESSLGDLTSYVPAESSPTPAESPSTPAESPSTPAESPSTPAENPSTPAENPSTSGFAQAAEEAVDAVLEAGVNTATGLARRAENMVRSRSGSLPGSPDPGPGIAERQGEGSTVKGSIVGWHVNWKHHRVAVTPSLTVSLYGTPKIKFGIDVGLGIGAHHYSPNVIDSSGLHKHLEIENKHGFFSFEHGNNNSDSYSLLGIGKRSNSFLNFGETRNKTSASVSINMLLQKNGISKEMLFIEGEVKHPIKNVNLKLVAFEFSNSANLKITPFGTSEKLNYKVITPDGTLQNLGNKLEILAQETTKIQKAIIEIKDNQAIALDVGEKQHIIELEKSSEQYGIQMKKIDQLYNEGHQHFDDGMSALETQVESVHKSIQNNGEQAEHCCKEMMEGFRQLGAGEHIDSKGNVFNPGNLFSNFTTLAIGKFLIKNTANIAIYFVVGTDGAIIYMIVQTALSHPMARRKKEVAQCLTGLRIGLSAFYWLSFLGTVAIIVTNMMTQKHILTKNYWIEKTGAKLATLEIWVKFGSNSWFPILVVVRTLTFYGFVGSKIADLIIVTTGGKLTKSVFVSNIYMVAFVTGSLIAHKLFQAWYASNLKDYKQKDWAITLAEKQKDTLHNELKTLGEMISQIFKNAKKE